MPLPFKCLNQQLSGNMMWLTHTQTHRQTDTTFYSLGFIYWCSQLSNWNQFKEGLLVVWDLGLRVKLTLYCGLNRVQYPRFSWAYSCQRRGTFYPVPSPDPLSRSKYCRDPHTLKWKLVYASMKTLLSICNYSLLTIRPLQSTRTLLVIVLEVRPTFGIPWK